MPEEKKGVAGILKKYFGMREGDNIRDFAEEVKALSDEDKQQLVQGIEDGTLNY